MTTDKLIVAWDIGVAAWREMRSQRPLGPYYTFPAVSLPPELTISPKRHTTGEYPAALWTMDSVACGA